MRRRALLIALGAGLALPGSTFAQAKVRRIGFLAVRHCSTPSNPEVYYDTFVAAMRALGYIESTNLAIEWRCADGDYQRMPRLAAELVQMRPEVIVTHSSPATEALRRATSTIPIVTAGVGDPVGSGFAKSLARPEGNITGLSVIVADSGSKHLELLKSAVPGLTRVALIVNPDTRIHETLVKSVQNAARNLGLSVYRVNARTPAEIEQGFDAMARERVGAVMVANDAFYISRRTQIVELAARHRLPSSFYYREDVVGGGLLSYGEDIRYQYRRAADYVDRILKGATPSELPFEQPTKIILTLNRKTAKALGITLPQELLLRADEVIE